MLIDLERNDLGRVCVGGSVQVDESMSMETYAHVHHIVSNVSGRLRDAVTPVEAIRALFPGGTITGCPKVRCMEIIAELEGAGRGAYTGSIGYLNRDGSCDLNILIRTITARGDAVSVFAPAPASSPIRIPRQELAETRAKAEGLLRALEPAPLERLDQRPRGARRSIIAIADCSMATALFETMRVRAGAIRLLEYPSRAAVRRLPAAGDRSRRRARRRCGANSSRGAAAHARRCSS